MWVEGTERARDLNFDKLTPDLYTCIILLAALLLNRMQKSERTFSQRWKWVREYNVIFNVRHITEEIQRRDCLHLNLVWRSQKKDKLFHKIQGIQQERIPCMACGGRHLRKECPFKKAKYFHCEDTRDIKPKCKAKLKNWIKWEKINSLT